SPSEIGREFLPTGRKANCDIKSVHFVSDTEAAPVMTSRMPSAPAGANAAESDRFRKLQSTRITRAPAFAMSNAKAAATVDFPSFCCVEVIPITWFRLPLRFIESMASLISTNDSVNRDCGESVIVQIGLSVRTMFRDVGRPVDAGLDRTDLDTCSLSVNRIAIDARPFAIELTGLSALANFIGCFPAGPEKTAANFS